MLSLRLRPLDSLAAAAAELDALTVSSDRRDLARVRLTSLIEARINSALQVT
jgi:hypothetical protein